MKYIFRVSITGTPVTLKVTSPFLESLDPLISIAHLDKKETEYISRTILLRAINYL